MSIPVIAFLRPRAGSSAHSKAQLFILAEPFQGGRQCLDRAFGGARRDFHSAFRGHVKTRAREVQTDNRLTCGHSLHHNGSSAIPKAGEKKNIAGIHLGEKLLPRHPVHESNLASQPQFIHKATQSREFRAAADDDQFSV